MKSLSRKRSRLSARRAALIPAVFIGLPLLTLLVLQFRAINSFETTTEQLLRDVNQHLADEVATRVQRDFKSPLFNVIEKVNHQYVVEFRLDDLIRELYREKEHAKLIEIFFVWSVNSGQQYDDSKEIMDSEVRFLAVRGGNALTDVSKLNADAFYRNPSLASIVIRLAQEFTDLHSIYGMAYQDYEGKRYDFVYHLRYGDNFEHTDLSAFYGFIVDSQQLTEVYFPEMVSELRAQAMGTMGMPIPEISILNDAGEEIYRSGPSLKENFVYETQFPFIFFDIDIIHYLKPLTPEVDIPYWTVRTGSANANVDSIAWTQTNRIKLLWAVIASVAVAGVALTARASAREARLAEMKADFVSGVSHDLRTPLATIQVFAETISLGRARTAEKVLKYAKIIEGEAVRLGHLIESLLDFDAMEAGLYNKSREAIDLRTPVSSAIASCRRQLKAHDFRTEVILPDREVLVLGNDAALQQVFRNLIGNAINYSDSSCCLRVALWTSNGHAFVDVIDHGIGIPARELENIFNRFYRVRKDPLTGPAGTGIGLTLVEHVVRNHGGNVLVKSRRGEGSTFTVKLPLVLRTEGQEA